MVLFSNRLEPKKQDTDDRSNGAPDERERTNQSYERVQHTDRIKAMSTNPDSESIAEKAPEDLAGRVCYELDPLVDS
ncbi:hypothetical protein AMECASPLE_033859 [Ameca splendens]|uniref:Uncharacterized protein n=1 Tax=Ameca splendens TaxID=208324 RepID=A0ABV1AEG3_9TELE